MATSAINTTYSGMTLLWGRFKGLGAEPLNIGWGTAYNTFALSLAAPFQINLGIPATETRVAGTSTVKTVAQLGDTYQVVGTLTCLVAAKSIGEAALFDTTTLSSSKTEAFFANATSLSVTVTFASSTGLPSSGNYYLQACFPGDSNASSPMLVTAGQGSSHITGTNGALGLGHLPTSSWGHNGNVYTVGGDGGAFANFGLGGQTATIGAAQGGSMFMWSTFPLIALNVNDSIQFTFTNQLI